MPESAHPDGRSAGRYEIIRSVGSGGAAHVYEARDLVTNRRVALKRLKLDEGAERERRADLFKREFFTLSQLAHPNVVEVYDYAVDEEGPRYAMELLDGGDLVERSPLPYRDACRVARDVCSALSLVHSRRLVYRDLSPRNVRCTSDGRAKLIDFGALTPMGQPDLFVGTPATSAPEAVHLQPVDARTDLYALGATLYYALTGRRPFQANKLAQLQEAWKTPPLPPSRYADDVPPALDSLVLELLQLDPALRPVSAAETMERLSAVGELERDESAAVASRAFLSTPVLVGRGASLGRLRAKVAALAPGTAGAALLVQGPPGVGRTRFLRACFLEAAVGGVTALQAGASDAGHAGVAGALGARLVEAMPEIARKHAEKDLALLARVVPALAPEAQAGRPPGPPPTDAELSPAFRDWFLSVASERPLFIAVDDVHRIDPPSVALLALLARETGTNPLLLVTSLPSTVLGEQTGALRLLTTQSQQTPLAPLGEQRGERLLRSVFGDVPNVRAVAGRLHAVSRGLPRDLMQLAQHLVDKGIVRFDGGSWSLPQGLDPGELPASMAEARRRRAEALGPDARALAGVLALGPDTSFTFDECLALTAHRDGGRLMAALADLAEADVVTRSAGGYALADRSLCEPLRGLAAVDERRDRYLLLAALYERRGGADRWRSALYLFDAGDEAGGVDRLVRFVEQSIAETDASMEAFARLLQSLPEDWLSLYDRGLSACARLGRPKRESMLLSMRVAGIGSQLPFDLARHFGPLRERLVHDTGLDFYAGLPAELDPVTRAKQSVGLAAKRFAERGAAECVHDPGTAIGLLGRMVASAMGNVASTLSVELLLLLPSLAPFAPLSPALGSWQTLVEGVGARVLGQSERAREIYERQLVRLAQPDRAGLDETYRVTQELGITLGLGMLEAAMGLRVSLDRAEALSSSPLHEINAMRIRSLYHLWQGDFVTSDRWKERAELLGIERGRRQTNEGAHLPRELLGTALSDDLTRVRRAVDAIEPLTRRAQGWIPVLHWGNAEYQRIRGNLRAALAETLAALAAMHPAGHAVWTEVAALHVRLLVSLGRAEEARAAGALYLEESARRGIGYERNYLTLALSLALSRLGRHDEARAASDGVIAAFEALGTTGMNVGLAHECRAYIALERGDVIAFDESRESCARVFRGVQGGPLAAKYERLVLASQRNSLRSPRARREASTGFEATTEITASLARLRSTDERQLRMLTLLLETSGAIGGVLFTTEGGKIQLGAKVGSLFPSKQMHETAARYIADQQNEEEHTVATAEASAQFRYEWDGVEGCSLSPVLLSHYEDGKLVATGLALLEQAAGAAYRHPGDVAVTLSQILGEQHAGARLATG